jgi:hypothetical protein
MRLTSGQLAPALEFRCQQACTRTGSPAVVTSRRSLPEHTGRGCRMANWSPVLAGNHQTSVIVHRHRGTRELRRLQEPDRRSRHRVSRRAARALHCRWSCPSGAATGCLRRQTERLSVRLVSRNAASDAAEAVHRLQSALSMVFARPARRRAVSAPSLGWLLQLHPHGRRASRNRASVAPPLLAWPRAARTVPAHRVPVCKPVALALPAPAPGRALVPPKGRPLGPRPMQPATGCPAPISGPGRPG